MQTDTGSSKNLSLSEAGAVKPTLAERIWDFSWNEVLPRPIGTKGVIMTREPFDEIATFAATHFERIFEIENRDNPFLNNEPSGYKERYYRETADIFGYRLDGELIGVTLSEPLDWNSYHVRHHSVLEKFQGLGITQGFLNEVVIPELKKLNVKRIQIETSPANLPVIQILTRLRFNITGTVLSERWGANLCMTKFLDPRNESVFLEQFCFGNHPQAKNSS